MQKSYFLPVTMTEKEQRTGLLYLILNLLPIPAVLTFSLQLLFPGISGAKQNFIYFVFNFVCIVVIFRHFLWESIKSIGDRPFRLIVTVFFGLLAYFLLSYQLFLWMYNLAPEFSNVNDSSIAALAAQNYPLMSAGTIFLVPVAEECLYRGLVFGSLLKKNTFFAYLISTFVFCCIHVIGYIGKYEFGVLLLCFIQYIPAGICLGWAYHKSGSIFAPILIHAIINAIGIFSVR